MSFTKSLSMIVPAPQRDDCNRLMLALGKDNAPDPGRTFSVELSPTGKATVTHYGAHGWDDDLAAILDSGTLPAGINWPAFNLTENAANQALAIIKYFAVANRTPRANFEQKVGAEGLLEIEVEEI